MSGMKLNKIIDNLRFIANELKREHGENPKHETLLKIRTMEGAIKELEKNNWIPVEERLPADNRYILLSFENFSLPLVGRYEDNGFYIGDCDEGDTCVANDLFVNAWMELPEAYRPNKEK